METVVIAYLAAFAAGRIKRLAGQIGEDATEKVDQTLYQVYVRLARRVPALQRLYDHPDDGATRQRATQEAAWALQDERLRAEVQQLIAQAETLSHGTLLHMRDVTLSATGGGVAVNQANAPINVDNRTSHRTYADDQGFHDLHESSGVARKLMIVGISLAMVGLCLFFFGIYTAVQGDTVPDGIPTSIAVGFGVTVVGILLGNFGRMLHAARH